MILLLFILLEKPATVTSRGDDGTSGSWSATRAVDNINVGLGVDAVMVHGETMTIVESRGGIGTSRGGESGAGGGGARTALQALN